MKRSLSRLGIVFFLLLQICIPLAYAKPPVLLGKEISSWALMAWGFNELGKDNTEFADVVIVDLDYQSDQIQGLKSINKIVICYISGGTYESFRSEFYDGNEAAWTNLAFEDPVVGFEDERWLDISRLNELKDLLRPRFDKAKNVGCDGLEIDNVDCYQNENCNKHLKNTYTTSEMEELQVNFNTWQADYAASISLIIGLKNTLDLISKLPIEKYAFAVNEQCVKYSECSKLSPFVEAGKPVFHVEYTPEQNNCDVGKENGLISKVCQNNPSHDGVCAGTSWENCEGNSAVKDPSDSNSSANIGVILSLSFFLAAMFIFFGYVLHVRARARNSGTEISNPNPTYNF